MATLGEVLRQARQLFAAGQLAQAEALYRQLTAAAPQVAELWHELGMVEVKAGRCEEAVEHLLKATALEPAVAVFHSNLGAVYRMLKRTDDAVDSFRRAVACSEPSAEFSSNLALALKDSGQTRQALESFDEALRIRPDFANGHFNRGNLLLDIGRLDEAIQSYRASLALNPHDAGAYCKLGVAYYDQARFDEALDCFERALAIQPHYPEVRRNRSLAWLARGEYAQGWPEFEWRLECEGFNKREFPQPRWEGAPLSGRTLLVHAEQGLGDTLHFIRYVPLVEQQGGLVRLQVQPPLVPLVRESGFARWLVAPEALGDFDAHAPLMSLGGYLPDRAGQPYWPGRYLAANAERVARWRSRLQCVAGFKVGIVWAGNPDHSHDRFRSVKLAEFAPLAAVPGVRLVSLQKGAGREQVGELAGRIDILDLGSELDEEGGAFMDTAAVVASLDLVITVDTALAHLAGGLGANVWVALQLSPDWRWRAAGSSTPWYPSMRLFRQREFDAWPRVFDKMATALGELVAGRPA